MNELQKKLARRRALNGEGTNNEEPSKVTESVAPAVRQTSRRFSAEELAPFQGGDKVPNKSIEAATDVRPSSRRFSKEDLAPFQGGDKAPVPATPSYLRKTNSGSSHVPHLPGAASAVTPPPMTVVPVAEEAKTVDPVIAAEPAGGVSKTSHVEEVAVTTPSEPIISIAVGTAQNENSVHVDDKTENAEEPPELSTGEVLVNVAEDSRVDDVSTTEVMKEVIDSHPPPVVKDSVSPAERVVKNVPPPPPVVHTPAEAAAERALPSGAVAGKQKEKDTTLGDLEELQDFLGDMNDSFLSSLDNTEDGSNNALSLTSGTSSSQRYNAKKAQLAAGEESDHRILPRTTAEFDIMQTGSRAKKTDELFSLDDEEDAGGSKVITKVVKNKLKQRLSTFGFDPNAISMVDMFDSTGTTSGDESAANELLPSGGKLFSFDVSATSLLQGNKALLKKEEGHEEISRQKAAVDRRMRLDHHGLFSSDNVVDKGEVDDGAKPSSALFQEDVSAIAKKKTVVKVETLSYDDFMNKLTQFESKPVMDAIRRFFASILGPRGDGSPPPANTASKLSYTFHGIDQLDKRCSDFFEAMIEHFQTDPLWKHLAEDEDQRIVLRNHLEMYIMNPIAEMAFKSVTNKAEDDALYRKMRSLSFLKPEALDINPALQNDIVFSLAGDALRKMNNHRIPHDKAECVVNCASILFRSLSLASAKTNDDSECVAFGADDFLPIFIYVVLRSNVPKLVSNCEYIQAFYNPAQLMSKAGYFFVNLRSAMEFILNLEVSSINMDPEEFNRKLAEAEDDYN